jgi:hypothetical protein
MCGDGRVSHEAGFSARCEETHTHVVIGGVGLQHERRIGIVQLARDAAHFVVRAHVGGQDDTGRVSGELPSREGIDLKYMDTTRHA